MLSFDIVLRLLTLLMREVPGTELQSAAAQWIMLLASPGPALPSVRPPVARPLLISAVLMGKECFKPQPKGVWLSACDKQSFQLSLRRGKACRAPMQTQQHLRAPPCLLPHLICGQGDNLASQPTHLAFLQHSWMPIASGQLAHCNLEPTPAEIPGRPAADPMAPHGWDWNSLILLKIHSLLAWEYPIWGFVFFFWSHLFPITVPVITLPQTLSLPLTSMPCLIPPEMLPAGMMSSWAPCITADAGGLTNERASASLAGSAFTGNRRGRLMGWQTARASGSWSPFTLWLWARSNAGERPICFIAKSPWLPGWSEPCPAHCYTASWQLCKGIQCFLLGCLSGFFFPCMHP